MFITKTRDVYATSQKVVVVARKTLSMSAILLGIGLLHQVAQVAAQDTRPGVKVGGHVVRQGAQRNQTRIQLVGARGITRASTINPDESFEFLDVKPGTYLLIDGQRLTMHPVIVAVTDKDVLGLHLEIIPSQTDVMIAGWDAKSGRVTAAAIPVAAGHEGVTSGPDWSFSGDQIAVQIGEPSDPNGVSLLIHSFSDSGDRVVRPELSMFSRPRFSPDARSVVAQGRRSQDAGVAIQEIDLKTGAAKVLVTGQNVINPSWSNDGSMLFFEENFESVFAWTRETGQRRLIYRSPTKSGGAEMNLNSAPSPAAHALAVVDGSVLYFVDVASGEKRPIVELHDPDRFLFPGSLAWTPDGRWILFGKMTPTAGELWRVSPDGKELGPAGFSVTDNYVYFLRVSPDNKRLAFAVGNNMLRREALSQALESVSRQ